MNDLDDLPRMEELEMMLKRKEVSTFSVAPPDDEKVLKNKEAEIPSTGADEKTEQPDEKSLPTDVDLSMIEETCEAEVEIPVGIPPEPPSLVTPDDETE